MRSTNACGGVGWSMCGGAWQSVGKTTGMGAPHRISLGRDIACASLIRGRLVIVMYGSCMAFAWAGLGGRGGQTRTLRKNRPLPPSSKKPHHRCMKRLVQAILGFETLVGVQVGRGRRRKRHGNGTKRPFCKVEEKEEKNARASQKKRFPKLAVRQGKRTTRASFPPPCAPSCALHVNQAGDVRGRLKGASLIGWWGVDRGFCEGVGFFFLRISGKAISDDFVRGHGRPPTTQWARYAAAPTRGF